MRPLAEAILSEGVETLAHWRKAGFDGTLGINLSASLFERDGLVERLYEPARFFDIEADKLDFEVTESSVMDQPQRAIDTLAALRERGSTVSIDDFGTGHSSLAYVADLPVNTIKIDKHFVQNLSTAWGRAIVSAATTLADKLGLSTLAEGLEDRADSDRCKELGVAYGQGFSIAAPMGRHDCEAWLGL